MPFFTDGVFGPLASRLGQIDVEKTYRQAIEVASGDGVEYLRMELRADGAPRNVREAVKALRPQGLTGGAGIPDSNPASDDALEWELGAMDGSTPPHGTFRMVADDMADDAAAEAASRFSKQIVGVS